METSQLRLRATASAVVCLLFAACTSAPPDPAYFKVFTEYERRDIERELATDSHLSRSVRGDPDAISRILRCATGDGRSGGEKGEACSIRILTAMLHLGDHAFARALSREDPATREAVGESIDWVFAAKNLEYPKTRGLYAYRENRHAAAPAGLPGRGT